MNEVDDWALVARAQSGDRAAFAALVRRYAVPLAHFCQRMTGSAEDGEDLAQEALVRLHRHLPRLAPQARFSTVLFGIARNLTLNHLRDTARRGRGKTQPLEAQPLAAEAARQPDRQARFRELETLVQQAIGLLSEEHREVLLLRETQDMDYAQIAETLAIAPGTVKSRIARAREQLRIRLIELGVNLHEPG
jgi:RNA polymerase sigma-70 factor (ECF subfamily)